jgi:hypothetical protein
MLSLFHTHFQFTAARALGFSVSTSCLLAMDLNTDTITSNHYEVFLLLRLQSFCTNLYSTNLHNSLTAQSCTALVPIRFSTPHRLLISLHYSTHKVFKSQANFFFDYELPSAISYCQLPRTLNCFQLQLPPGFWIHFLWALCIDPVENMPTAAAQQWDINTRRRKWSPTVVSSCLGTMGPPVTVQQCLEQIRHNILNHTFN